MTRFGQTASGDQDWIRLETGLPDLSIGGKGLNLDFAPSQPGFLYASVINPFGPADEIEQTPFLGIYASPNEGFNWTLLKKVSRNNSYNDFIRAHPDDLSLIYLGGVALLKDEKLATRVSQGGLARVERLFTKDVVMEALAGIYKGAVKKA